MSCTCIRRPASLTGVPKTEDVSYRDACSGTKTPSSLATIVQVNITGCDLLPRRSEMEILYRPRLLVGKQLLSPSLRWSNCPSISDLDRRPADVGKVQSPRARTKLDSLRAPTKAAFKVRLFLQVRDPIRLWDGPKQAHTFLPVRS